jgi:transposase
MACPYSHDLRERVASAVLSGERCRFVARTFGVSVASAVRWSQRARQTDNAAAYAMGGHRPWSLEPERDWLMARLGEKLDLTLHALLAELAARDVVVCYDTLWRFLKREGVSFKKPVSTNEQDRPGVARRRAWWKRHQHRLDPRRLVFIDETWAKTNMIRSHGWFSRLMRLMRARTSRKIGGPPPPRRRDFYVQYSRKPFRCQPMTVSGFTITSISRQFGKNRDRSTQIGRSFGRREIHVIVAS